MSTEEMAASDGQYPLQDLTGQIIAAAYEVHRQLGGGFLEKVYENALAVELEQRGLNAVAQAPVEVAYKGRRVGHYYADVFVERLVICELKAGDAIAAQHQAQLLHYLKATGVKVGLLLNFGPKRVDVKRMVL